MDFGFIPTTTTNNVTTTIAAPTSAAGALLPQSPIDPFRCDENIDTSCCTSPSSILSTSSHAGNISHPLSQQPPKVFPSPSTSPYQNASADTQVKIYTNDTSSFLPTYAITKEELLDQDVDFSMMTHTNKNDKKRSLEQIDGSVDDDDDDDDETKRNSKKKPTTTCSEKLANSEIRRQIHIQSEQKRRAQIKDGFEDLRNELPSCLNKKMSKVALLHRSKSVAYKSKKKKRKDNEIDGILPHFVLAVQHIQHLKNTQMTILAELERLVSENGQLRK